MDKTAGQHTPANIGRQDSRPVPTRNYWWTRHSISNTFVLLLFSHNSHGTKEILDCGNQVRPDWVGNLRWDITEPYEPFRWVNTEPSVQFRKTNTDPSVQFRRANTDPSMQFRWGHTEFLFCKMLRKNLHESVWPLSHSQTSPGKSSCQDAFGKSLCNALLYCHAMPCYVMPCTMPCTMSYTAPSGVGN